jgi:chromosome segregation ATPase
MENVDKMITSIEFKVKRLIEQHNEIKENLQRHQNEIQELKTINEQHQKTIIELKERITLLKIAKSTETKEGAVDAKLKINEMVREIDKCIGLLNR